MNMKVKLWELCILKREINQKKVNGLQAEEIRGYEDTGGGAAMNNK